MQKPKKTPATESDDTMSSSLSDTSDEGFLVDSKARRENKVSITINQHSIYVKQNMQLAKDCLRSGDNSKALIIIENLLKAGMITFNVPNRYIK